MPFFVALALIFVLIGFTWWAVAHEPGPGPADVAYAYEQAWDALDFGLLYDLSGDELRDGMRRDEFVAAKRAAHELTSGSRTPADVAIESVHVSNVTAVAVTRVATARGSIRNTVVMERRANGWVVVEYSLRAEGAGGNARAS
jgi:hypothetical protein